MRCNLVAPWFVQTPMTEDISATLAARKIEAGKGFTWAQAEDVAGCVALCAVDDQVNGTSDISIFLKAFPWLKIRG